MPSISLKEVLAEKALASYLCGLDFGINIQKYLQIRNVYLFIVFFDVTHHNKSMQWHSQEKKQSSKA